MTARYSAGWTDPRGVFGTNEMTAIERHRDMVAYYLESLTSGKASFAFCKMMMAWHLEKIAEIESNNNETDKMVV